METINKLTAKYFIIKIDDVLRFGNDTEIKQFNEMATKIALRRQEEGKGANTYLVLNLEDEINFDFLLEETILIQKAQKKLKYEACQKETNAPDYFTKHFDFTSTGKVKDIAVSLVNAILSTKLDA